jgi:uncharacterized protein YjbI with pentapeptide repeats
MVLILGGAGVIVTAYFSAQTLRVSQETLQLSKNKEFIEKFTKSIEQLRTDNLAMRMASIYMLERIITSSEDDSSMVMEVLTSFVREQAPARKSIYTGSTQKNRKTEDKILLKPPPDIQAVLTVLGRRKTTFRDMEHLNLRETNLAGADLRRAQLQRADLEQAELQGAILVEVQLQEANLMEAQLQRAFLGGAQLRKAFLRGAQLQGADLRGAELQGAFLGHAQLQEAYLAGAQLQGAFLEDAQLQGAYLAGAQLQGATLRGADLRGADLRGVHLQGATQ